MKASAEVPHPRPTSGAATISPLPSPRVLHVGKFFPPQPGGIERYLADLLAAAAAAGDTVAALVHRPAGAAQPGTDADFPVFSARSYGHLLYTPLSPGFPAMLLRAIHRFRADILHLHLPNPSAFAALLLPSARRLPWVVHWHADVDTAEERWIRRGYQGYRIAEQALLRRSARVIASSPPYLEFSSALAPWRDRCRIIPLGVDLPRLQTIATTARRDALAAWPDGTGLRILAVGRLTYYKGFMTLLQALQQTPESRLVIVGDGPERPVLARAAAQPALSDRVRLLGYRSDAELHALMAECDVLCLPSLDRSEAFGIVLLEALRYGCPVIASDIPGSGVGWVVREAGHGLLVPPGDARALAAALKRLAEAPELRMRLAGAHTMGSGLARFDIRNHLPAFRDLYAEIQQANATPQNVK